jgi:glycosyltransferase involved in cell wall biosynthesis
VRVALVHDNLWQAGGAERVLQVLRQVFPQAPVFTLGIADEVRPLFHDANVRASFLQRLPLPADRLRRLAALFPVTMRGFNLSGYDLIVSSSWGFAKGIQAPARSRHVCYCHSLLNWAWETESYAEGERLTLGARVALRAFARSFRRWDYRTAQSVTHFVANSRYTAKRVGQYYRRESTVIPPPVDLDFWKPTRPKGNFGVVVSRLVPHKRIDIAIAAFAKLNLPLYVVGDGRDRGRLEAIASPNARFMGWVKDEVIRDMLSAAHVILVPGKEDFGIVFLESLACGTPVVAYGAGGALELIADGENGWLVPSQNADAFAEVVAKAFGQSIPPEPLRATIQEYALPNFRDRMRSLVSRLCALPEVGAITVGGAPNSTGLG